MTPMAEQAMRRVFAFLEQRFALVEREGVNRGPWLMSASRGASRGQVRCYAAPDVDKVVQLTFQDDDQLDAAILMAFAPPSSPLPHLTLDVARVGRDFAVFVDLLPRVDLAVNPSYVREVYGPLRDAYDGLGKHPQLKASPIPYSLTPFVSPWMRGFRMRVPQIGQLFELVGPYVSHWATLHTAIAAVPVETCGADLAARDLAHRRALFSRDADPVWEMITQVIGDERAQKVLGLVRGHGIAAPPSLKPPATSAAR